MVNGELRARARHSRLKLTDVIQQRLRRVFPLSLHALADSHEQPRSPLRETEAFLLVGLDILCVDVCERAYRSREAGGLRGRGRIGSHLLTVMIWRMERRMVAAATVGGNGSMDETLEAI